MTTIAEFLRKTKALNKSQRFSEVINTVTVSHLTKFHSEELYIEKAIAYLGLNRVRDSLALCETALKINRKYAKAYNTRGSGWYMLQEWNIALSDFKRATRLDSRLSSAYNNIGLIKHEKKEYRKAVAYYNKTIKLNPYSDATFNNRGNSWLAQNKFNEAIADYNMAIMINPYNSLFYNNRGIASYKKKDYHLSIYDFKKSIELNPLESDYYYNLGVALYDKREFYGALNAYERALDFQSKDPDLISNRSIVRSLLNELNKEHEFYDSKNDVIVSINFLGKNFNLDEIENKLIAIDYFMGALGCQLWSKEQPIIASYFQKLIYRCKLKKARKEIKDLYEQGKSALKANYINLPTAQATSELADSAANLIKSLENMDEAALRLGAILLVKTVNNGKSVIIAETVSPEIMEQLNNDASLLRNPNSLFKLLTEDNSKNE